MAFNYDIYAVVFPCKYVIIFWNCYERKCLQLFLCFLFPFVILVTIIFIKHYIAKREYQKSFYYQETGLSYNEVIYDKGKYGEYLTYSNLKIYENYGARFLFNIYLPKNNGELSEIDVLMICSKGLFVIESKNYSGWIFGSELQKYWHQILPKGSRKSQKNQFYNPIMQNHSHIKYLKSFLGMQLPTQSIIAFSDRCTLKSVQVDSLDVSVVNRRNVSMVVSEFYNRPTTQYIAEKTIDEIYSKLLPLTKLDEVSKTLHTSNVHNSASSRNDRQNTTSSSWFESENLFVCPKCGGDLVVRIVKKGPNIGRQFYGCSNYPKCKYTRNL